MLKLKIPKIEVITMLSVYILWVEELTGFSSEAVLPSTVLMLGYGIAEVDFYDWSIILDPLYRHIVQPTLQGVSYSESSFSFWTRLSINICWTLVSYQFNIFSDYKVSAADRFHKKAQCRVKRKAYVSE